MVVYLKPTQHLTIVNARRAGPKHQSIVSHVEHFGFVILNQPVEQYIADVCVVFIKTAWNRLASKL